MPVVGTGSSAATSQGPALPLSPPGAVWTGTHGTVAAARPCATDGRPLEPPGLLGQQSHEQERWEPWHSSQPQTQSKERDLGANLTSATAQVFKQINFYHNQSDRSVESKWASPTH